MNPEITALLRTLEHLAYIIECVADTIPGEAKSEMDSLSKRLGGDPDLQFEGSVEARETMVEACGLFRAGTEQERREAVLVLVRLSRSLWKQVLGKI